MALINRADRLPEEQPGVEWDISRGVRMSLSAVHAIEKERQESSDSGGLIDKLNVAQEMTKEEIVAANRQGSMVLRVVAEELAQGATIRDFRDVLLAPGFGKKLVDAYIRDAQ